MRVTWGSSSLRCLYVGASFALPLLIAGCGGGGGGPSSSELASVTGVVISGPAYSQAGFCVNFTATVSGSGPYDHTVQWYVNGVAGGSANDGTISSTGSYCAPAQPPSTNPVQVKAVASGDQSRSATMSTRIVEISITPEQVEMYTRGTQHFIATAIGGVNNSVTWEVNGVPGGNPETGTITGSGLYTAPAHVTNIGLSVQAVLTEAPTIYANADLFVSAQIVISPQNAQITYGSAQQFTATIDGIVSQVNWAATYGSISPSGLYTANTTESPDPIRAWATNANGSTTVQIAGLKPTITSISPQPATVLDQITVAGKNLNPIATVVFTDGVGGEIQVSGTDVGTNVNGTALTLKVPQGVVAGPLYVITQQGSLSPIRSNSLNFRRLARLRIRTPQKDLSAGESVTMQYALLGDATPRNVEFSADVGSFSDSAYLAPSTIASDRFAHIKACIVGTKSCDQMLLRLHPFRIVPDPPLVGIGKTLQLSAFLGSGPAGADWNLLSGGGTVTSNGLYTAGTTIQSGGPAGISATSSGQTEESSVGITGAFPGLVNRIVDYVDQHDANATGSYVYGMAVAGTKLYVSASNHVGFRTDSYFWIDVYDISDTLHPVWITAVESYSGDSLFSIGPYLYSYGGRVVPVPGYANAITLYSVEGGVPVLLARAGIPNFWAIAWNQGVLTVVENTGVTGTRATQEVLMYDVTGGTISTTHLNLPLSGNANDFLPDATLKVGNRLFRSMVNNDGVTGSIFTYDLSVSPPRLLGTIDGQSLRFYSAGNFLFGAFGGIDIYDISSELPQLQAHIDGINAQQLNGNQLLAYTLQQGCQIVDLNNPQDPKVTSILFDGVIAGCSWASSVGKYVYSSEFPGGIAIYDASQTGGPRVDGLLYSGPHLFSVAYDLRLQSPYLYAATSTFDGAVLNVYDASTNPLNRISEYFDPTQQGFAIEPVGNYAYFGMSRNTGVLDVSAPSSPSLVAILPLPTLSFARSGNILYAGTSNRTIAVINVSNPAQPSIVRTIAVPDLAVKLKISGNQLFVADSAAGLLIYDISSPASPALLSRTSEFVGVNDVAMSGTTVFLAADTDGLGIVNVSNPAQPSLLSKTSLSRIDPFFSDNPPNEALSITINNGIVYVGTLADNGLVFGLDCTRVSAPRIVSVYAYGDFIDTWVGTLLASGTQLFVGGALGPNVYPVAHVDISHPFDSINQYFPPLELQSAPQLSAASRGKLQVLTKPLSSQNLARPQSHHAIVNPENPKSFRR